MEQLEIFRQKDEEENKKENDEQDLAEKASIEKLAELEKLELLEVEGEDIKLTEKEFNEIYPDAKLIKNLSWAEKLKRLRELQKEIAQRKLPFEKKE